MISRDYAKVMKETEFLSEETERELIRRYRLDGDLVAREKLVNAFMKYSVKCARDHKNKTSCPTQMEDLVSEAVLGFITCLDKLDLAYFEPDNPKKIRLVTYAYHWIKAFLNKPELNNNSIVQKLTGSRRSIFFAINKAMKKRDYSYPLSREEVEILAGDMGVKVSDVVSVINFSRGDVSTSSDEFSFVEGNYVDTDVEVVLARKIDAANVRSTALKIMDDVLDTRERDLVFNITMMETPVKTEELSKKYGVSRAFIKKLERDAMKKVQHEFKKRGFKR